MEEAERELERERELEKQKYFRPQDSFPEPIIDETSNTNLGSEQYPSSSDPSINTPHNSFNNNQQMNTNSEKGSNIAVRGSVSNISTEQEHESRQNIVGDAKIRTDNLSTGLQNVKEKIDQSTERIKGLRDNLSSPSQELNQMHLTTAGKEIASTIRTNMDPKFGMEELGNDKKEKN